MSMIDINNMSPSGMVSQYVVEVLGAGHFLSREDYTRVEEWLRMAASAEDLLLVLEDVLPARVEKARAKGKKVFSLSSVRKSVEKRLMDRRSLLGTVAYGS